MPQHDDEVGNTRMPVMPRIHDPEMRPPQQVQPIEIEQPVDQHNQSEVTKTFVERSKGLFTSAMDNKLIVFIIVLIVIIIGVVAYFMINKNNSKEAKETQTPKHSFLDKFKRNKPVDAPAEEAPQPEVKDKTMSHDDIMNMESDHLDELRRQRSTSAGVVAAVPEKKEFNLNEYMKEEASAPIENDDTDDDVDDDVELPTVATALYPNKPEVEPEVEPEQVAAPPRQQSVATEHFDDNSAFDDAFSAAIMDSSGVDDDEEQPEVVNVQQPPSVGGCTQLLKTGHYCKNKAKEGNRCHLHV